MTAIVIDHVPGMREALELVQLVGGVLLTPEAAEQITVASWYGAEPVARVAAFADAADILDEFAADIEDSTMRLGLRLGALVLDQMSHEMRSPK